MQEYIYALYHYINGTKTYFYVGRSERTKGIRFEEHRANVNRKSHTEDVYTYIREQVLCQIFEEEILCTCSDNANDYEDFYVIKLIRDGHNLQNMKHGDQKKIALLSEITELNNNSIVINSVSDLRRHRSAQTAKKLQDKIRTNHSSPTLAALLSTVEPVSKVKRNKRAMIKQADKLTATRNATRIKKIM